MYNLWSPTIKGGQCLKRLVFLSGVTYPMCEVNIVFAMRALRFTEPRNERDNMVKCDILMRKNRLFTDVAPHAIALLNALITYALGLCFQLASFTFHSVLIHGNTSIIRLIPFAVTETFLFPLFFRKRIPFSLFTLFAAPYIAIAFLSILPKFFILFLSKTRIAHPISWLRGFGKDGSLTVAPQEIAFSIFGTCTFFAGPYMFPFSQGKHFKEQFLFTNRANLVSISCEDKRNWLTRLVLAFPRIRVLTFLIFLTSTVLAITVRLPFVKRKYVKSLFLFTSKAIPIPWFSWGKFLSTIAWLNGVVKFLHSIRSPYRLCCLGNRSCSKRDLLPFLLPSLYHKTRQEARLSWV